MLNDWYFYIFIKIPFLFLYLFYILLFLDVLVGNELYFKQNLTFKIPSFVIKDNAKMIYTEVFQF